MVQQVRHFSEWHINKIISSLCVQCGSSKLLLFFWITISAIEVCSLVFFLQFYKRNTCKSIEWSVCICKVKCTSNHRIGMWKHLDWMISSCLSGKLNFLMPQYVTHNLQSTFQHSWLNQIRTTATQLADTLNLICKYFVQNRINWMSSHFALDTFTKLSIWIFIEINLANRISFERTNVIMFADNDV